MTLIPFEFTETVEPEPSPETSNDPAPTKDDLPPPPDVPAQVVVSPEALIDSLLIFPGPFESRWNRTMSREYREL